MTERWTYPDLYEKIDYEGGLEEALRWGIRARDVPVELEAKWVKLDEAFWAYEIIAEDVSRVLEARMDDE